MLPCQGSVGNSILTRRLVGLPLAEGDFAELCVLHRDERVLAAFGLNKFADEETREFLDAKLAHWIQHGFGIWMFRDRDRVVGRCGIHRTVIEGREELDLGYIVRSELWSNGYATEMAAAVVEHSFSALRLPSLVGATAYGNRRSQRVLEKLDFAYAGRFVDRGGTPAVLYRRWRAPD